MKSLLIPIALTTLVNFAVSTGALADAQLDEQVHIMSTSWASITYESDESAREKELSALSKQATMLLNKNPDDEELVTWTGIITASHAGAKGGLGALKIVKKAKKHFEHAMEINPEALNGGARSSLGALYYQVPGWPIGFGDSGKADSLLSESAEKHPDNLSSVFFYADFLLDQKRYAEARTMFEKAATIAPRSDALVADTGRLKQVGEKLALLDKIQS